MVQLLHVYLFGDVGILWGKHLDSSLESSETDTWPFCLVSYQSEKKSSTALTEIFILIIDILSNLK